MQLDLNDLDPQEASFTLSNNVTVTLKKFSLAASLWAERKFGADKMNTIFANKQIGDISQIAYYLLKDKSSFPTVDDFFECIVTQKDRVALVAAMLKTVGVSQPVMEKLLKKHAPQTEKEPTGV